MLEIRLVIFFFKSWFTYNVSKTSVVIKIENYFLIKYYQADNSVTIFGIYYKNLNHTKKIKN